MGYRNKIALLEIKVRDEIKDMTYKQLQKWYGDDYVPCYEIADEVYEIGKYWDHKFMKQFKKDIFTRPSTNKQFNEESEFYIVGKEGLKAIIDSYHDKILNYYKSILNPNPAEVEIGWQDTPEKAIQSKLKEWERNKWNVLPYNLDLKKDEVVSSWKFEYQIFELVRLYKTIDETKHLICITGW